MQSPEEWGTEEDQAAINNDTFWVEDKLEKVDSKAFGMLKHNKLVIDPPLVDGVWTLNVLRTIVFR